MVNIGILAKIYTKLH